MRTWDEYLSDVLVFVPECPDVVARGAVRDAAVDFCENSLCWQDTTDVYVLPSERDIPLTTDDDDILIVRPTRVGTRDLGDLEPKSARWLDRNLPGWRYDLGTPKYYTIPTKGVLWLAVHTDTAITLDLQLALKPGPDSTEGPDDLYEDHHLAIASGAIAQLASMPGKPWSNPALMALHAGIFTQARAAAGVKAARGNTNAALRTSFNHRF
ncbi:MAG TPA: hypothetical protein PKV98_04595 [Burkholderiaceae bacterium]|nr:hypothetical protein [Burkholderiaceae bacterium]